MKLTTGHIFCLVGGGEKRHIRRTFPPEMRYSILCGIWGDTLDLGNEVSDDSICKTCLRLYKGQDNVIL